MTKLKRVIVRDNKRLVFDMKLMPSGAWHTTYGPAWPGHKKKRPKKGRMATLMRKHKKWLNR